MVDLKAVYGKRYKIGMDASYEAETFPGKEKDVAWYYELIGKHGQLYCHSDTHLQIWVKPRIGKRIYNDDTFSFVVGYETWKIVQTADDGYAFAFPNAEISKGFDLIKPRRRRIGRTDPANLAMLRRVGFKPAPKT